VYQKQSSSSKTEEIYAVLMAQLVGAIGKYDPEYTQKVKEVVEAIEDGLREKEPFRAADVGRYLEFDCSRYLRMLCRRGFLETEREPAGMSSPSSLRRAPEGVEIGGRGLR
jgi:hypothetical protein